MVSHRARRASRESYQTDVSGDGTAHAATVLRGGIGHNFWHDVQGIASIPADKRRGSRCSTLGRGDIVEQG
jgi:hypothetical protein